MTIAEKALLPFAAFDNFSRSSTSGWGTSTSGQGWSTTDSASLKNFYTNSSNGVGVIESVVSDETTPRVITWQTNTETSTQSLLFSFNPVSYPIRSGGHQDFGPVLLYTSPKKYLVLRIQPGYNTVSLWKSKSGSPSLAALTPDARTNSNPYPDKYWYTKFDFVKNQWYWCRIEYSDTGKYIRYRIWLDGREEPTSWDSVYTVGKGIKEADLPSRKGTPGFMCFGTSKFVTHIRSVYHYAGSQPEYTSDGWAPDVTCSGDINFTDTFEGRTERQGFGKQSVLWYGSVIDNPNVLYPMGVGSVDNGTAKLEFTKAYTTNGGYWAFAGNTRPQDSPSEVTIQFRATELKEAVVLRIGPRGREGLHKGTVSGVGLGIQIPIKSQSKIRIARRSSLSAADWEIPSGGAGDTVEKEITLLENTTYTARVQIKPNGSGYELRAKVWESSLAEPASFDLTFINEATSPVRKGAAFINASSTGAGTVEILEVSTSTAVTEPVIVPPTNTFSVFEGFSPESTTTTADVQFRYNGTVTNSTLASVEYYPANNPDQRTIMYSSDGLVTSPANGSFTPTGGKLTGLTANTSYRVTGRLEQAGVATSSFSFNLQTKYDGIWIEEKRVHSTSTNGFTIALILRKDLPNSSYQDTTASLQLREVGITTSYAWSSGSPMNKEITLNSENYAGYGQPNFWLTISGLDSDKTYEYKITVSDPAGVDGKTSSELFEGTVTTFGRKPLLEWIDPSTGVRQPLPIEVVPEVTTARIRIHYKWDVNDETTFKVEYREFGSQGAAPYTTIYQEDPRKFIRYTSSLSNKFWEARLIGLLPGMDYSVDVYVTHPLGTVEGTTRYRLFFTTRRQSPVQSKEGKHYVYKVYDKDGNFLSTWTDAGDPSFGLHENGGVSDMTIKLPRQASSVMNDQSLTLGNRVDLWVIDHTSDGIGRNMITDSDFDLGAWTTSPSWSSYPNGGIDNGACLQVSTTTSTMNTSYALSEYLQAANSSDKVKPYRVVISVSNLLDQYEERLRQTNVNYNSIQTEASQTLRNLFPASFLGSNTVVNPQIDRIVDQNYGLLRKAKDTNNYQLLDSVELAFSSDSLDELNQIVDEAERQGCQVTVNEETEADSVPYVLMIAAKALKGQITAQIEYVDVVDPTTGFIATLISDESVSTFGSNWQVLKLEFTPPQGTRLMRVRLTSQGETIGYVDKAQLMPQELLIYRGRIETIKTSISGDSESINVEVMGLVAQLTDYYIQFKQWVDRQPAKDQPKLIDLSIPEDEAPPPTMVADTNLIKFRQSNTADNRHAILFPEITTTGVKLRVYYDGDDNETASCVVYYTPNPNSVLSNRVFTAVETGQFVYSIEPVDLVSETAGLTIVKSFPENSEFTVVSSTLNTDSDSIYRWVQVKASNSPLTGYLPFESLTDLRGSKAGGVASVVLSRSSVPKFDLWSGGESAGASAGSGAGAGSGGSDDGAGKVLDYTRSLVGWSDSQLYAWRNQVTARRTELGKLKTKYNNERSGLVAALGVPMPGFDPKTRIKEIDLYIKYINDELAQITKELQKIQNQLTRNARERQAAEDARLQSYGVPLPTIPAPAPSPPAGGQTNVS